MKPIAMLLFIDDSCGMTYRVVKFVHYGEWHLQMRGKSRFLKWKEIDKDVLPPRLIIEGLNRAGFEPIRKGYEQPIVPPQINVAPKGTIEKIKTLRNEFHITLKEAKEAIEEANYDLEEARKIVIDNAKGEDYPKNES